MMYAQAFFGLQLEFAEVVSALSGRPLADAVFEYTNFYIRFGLGRDFDPRHPRWLDYVSGLRGAHDRSDWTFRFYSSGQSPVAPPGVVETFGCFSYAWLSANRIR